MNIIKAEKISYSYPVPEVQAEEDTGRADTFLQDKVYAIRDVSLEIEKGSFICILGSNGSGKSTFARHLDALLTPDEGTLWIDGMDTKDASKLWDIRAEAGMVFQNPDNQIIGSVVDEEVAFGLENLGVASNEIIRRVYEALEKTGMQKFAKSSPNYLSGGQKQRVAIAGVLAMEPECIILDEATAMLDPRGRKEVMDTVLALNKEKNITVIAITHYMDEALSADRIYVMDAGQVVMQGSPKEIFSQGKKLAEHGLRLPQACLLADALRNAGLDIPSGIIDGDSLTECILAWGNRI